MGAADERRRAAPLAVRLVTFNVRYATTTPVAGETPWQVRCPKICNQLRFITTGHGAAFVCLQELLHQQVLDVRDALSRGSGSDGGGQYGDGGDEWAYIGRGRDDGMHAGEYSPVVYRPRVLAEPDAGAAVASLGRSAQPGGDGGPVPTPGDGHGRRRHEHAL